MPVHRALGCGLGLAVQLAPLFMLWALMKSKAPLLKLTLVVAFVAATALILVMFNVAN